MKKLTAALAVIGLMAAPSVASAAGQARENVSTTVSSAGLDLSKPEDVARLRDRVKRAIAEACTQDDRITSATPDRQCYREMAANAEGSVTKLAQEHGMVSHMASY